MPERAISHLTLGAPTFPREELWPCLSWCYRRQLPVGFFLLPPRQEWLGLLRVACPALHFALPIDVSHGLADEDLRQTLRPITLTRNL